MSFIFFSADNLIKIAYHSFFANIFSFGTLKSYFNDGDEEKKLKNHEYLGSSFASGLYYVIA